MRSCIGSLKYLNAVTTCSVTGKNITHTQKKIINGGGVGNPPIKCYFHI